jgi:hypothetical protein
MSAVLRFPLPVATAAAATFHLPSALPCQLGLTRSAPVRLERGAPADGRARVDDAARRGSRS